MFSREPPARAGALAGGSRLNGPPWTTFHFDATLPKLPILRTRHYYLDHEDEWEENVLIRLLWMKAVVPNDQPRAAGAVTPGQNFRPKLAERL
jgi:hypothetical protein